MWRSNRKTPAVVKRARCVLAVTGRRRSPRKNITFKQPPPLPTARRVRSAYLFTVSPSSSSPSPDARTHELSHRLPGLSLASHRVSVLFAFCRRRRHRHRFPPCAILVIRQRRYRYHRVFHVFFSIAHADSQPSVPAVV